MLQLQPRIVTIHSKQLVGKKVTMSLVNDKTQELWQGFMPLKNSIKHIVNKDLYSIQVYPKDISISNFTPETRFEKWAAIEVSKLEGGLYAVFLHKGHPAAFSKTMEYIFRNWLPKSKYQFDSRAQFEIMGNKYKNDDPASEEEVWIPIR